MTRNLETFNPRATYNTAAVDYDQTSADFWRYAAEETVRRLGLSSGASVLDVACGPGPAALAAGRAVGESGSVLGVDIAEQMIELARTHADEQGVRNVRFELGDLDALTVQPQSFDAATCVFGMFFATRIPSSVRAMAEAVRPGGQVAVTTLGPKFFSPMYEVFLDAATAENPAIDTDVPWRRTEDAEAMIDYLHGAGLVDVTASHEVSTLTLREPEDWWRIVTGTGIRRLAMDLDPDAYDRVRAHNLDWIRKHDIDSVEFGVIYARGKTRPSRHEPTSA